MVGPESKRLILTVQGCRAQAPHRNEARLVGCRGEMRHRVRAVGYVLASLSMTHGTYKHIRLRIMYSSFGLTNPVGRKAYTGD